MQSQELPLISVVVLTYNSSQYVLETLDSIYRQTYQGPIELIVTDDCSTDATVEICREWIELKKNRFMEVKIIESDSNIGISKNINKGCRTALGAWIKSIAGDDILMNECLEVLYNRVVDIGDKCSFISAPVYYFENLVQLHSISKLEEFFPVQKGITIDINYAFAHPCFILPAPGFFISKEMLEVIGYYPEIFKNIEDMPLTRKVLSKGYLIHTVERPVVFYRIHSQSITRTHLHSWVVSKCVLRSYKTFLFPQYNLSQRWDSFFRLLPIRLILIFKGRKNCLVSLAFICSHFFQITYYKKKFRL